MPDWLLVSAEVLLLILLLANGVLLIRLSRKLRRLGREVEKQMKEVGRFYLLNHVMTELVHESWRWHHARHPLWAAWAATMGPITVSVRRLAPDQDEDDEDEDEDEDDDGDTADSRVADEVPRH